jgi:hypothetical protein
VGLDIYKLRGTNKNRVKYPDSGSLPQGLFLVALYINSGSRAETLRHYSTISIDDVFDEYKGTLLICLDARTDSCIPNTRPCCQRGYEGKYCKWPGYFASTISRGLQNLRYLEIGEIAWGPTQEYHVQNRIMYPRRSISMLPLMGAILEFAGLHVQCFTSSPELEWAEVIKCNLLMNLEECGEVRQDFLVRNKAVYVEGRAPELQVWAWGKRKDCYVYNASPPSKGLEITHWRAGSWRVRQRSLDKGGKQSARTF